MSTQTTFAPERLKAFVDAVVAIAMTLLILPLLESVSESADEGTGEFLSDHAGQLMSFALSFALIAVFWMEHHGQYQHVKLVTTPMLWINAAWMLTIVWLPVPTSMLGQMESDPLQAVLYIGTLTVTQIVTLIGKLYLLRHPQYVDMAPQLLRRGAIGDIAAIILFCIALPIAAWVHVIGYFALLLVAFSGPLERLMLRWRG